VNGPRFAREVFAASRAVDREFAQDFAFAPFMAAAERAAPDVVDPSRASVTLRAVYVDPEAKPIEPNSYDVRQARRPGVESGVPQVEISPAEMARLSSALGVPFVIGAPDHLQRVEDGAWFRVLSAFVTPNGLTRLKVNRIS
jgi:hypothetical protein